MNTLQAVSEAEAILGLSISLHQQALLVRYVHHLRSWSGRVRLISRNDRDRIWERHVLDALSLLPHVPDVGPFIDVGSGGGLPGIPVAILRPDLEVVLLEPARMKALFLSEMVSVLELANTRSVRARAETLASDVSRRGTFQCATARAVGSLPQLWNWINPLLARDGVFIAMKGPGSLAEFPAGIPREIQVEEKEISLPVTGRPRVFISIRRCFT